MEGRSLVCYTDYEIADPTGAIYAAMVKEPTPGGKLNKFRVNYDYLWAKVLNIGSKPQECDTAATMLLGISRQHPTLSIPVSCTIPSHYGHSWTAQWRVKLK